MIPGPSLTPALVALRVLEALGQAFRDRAGEALPDLVQAYTDPVELANAHLSETARGWAGAFDLATTPDPRWLGKATGTDVPADLDQESAREFIQHRAHWRRGTTAALAAAISSRLQGSRRVDIYERDGSPWRVRIRVQSGDLGDATLADLAAAAAPQKPVGIVLVFEVGGSSYDHLAAEHGTYEELAVEFPTYDALFAHTPEEGTIP